MRKKSKQDVILQVGKILGDGIDLESEGMEVSDVRLKKDDEEEQLVMSGRMDIGQRGKPVTVLIEDEETGEALEINHVRNVLILMEDSRRSSNSWLSLVVGNVDKVGEILKFVARATMEELRKLVNRSD